MNGVVKWGRMALEHNDNISTCVCLIPRVQWLYLLLDASYSPATTSHIEERWNNGMTDSSRYQRRAGFVSHINTLVYAQVTTHPEKAGLSRSPPLTEPYLLTYFNGMADLNDSLEQATSIGVW